MTTEIDEAIEHCAGRGVPDLRIALENARTEIARLRSDIGERDTRIAQLVEANDCISEFEAEIARLMGERKTWTKIADQRAIEVGSLKVEVSRLTAERDEALAAGRDALAMAEDFASGCGFSAAGRAEFNRIKAIVGEQGATETKP